MLCLFRGCNSLDSHWRSLEIRFLLFLFFTETIPVFQCCLIQSPIRLGVEQLQLRRFSRAKSRTLTLVRAPSCFFHGFRDGFSTDSKFELEYMKFNKKVADWKEGEMVEVDSTLIPDFVYSDFTAIVTNLTHHILVRPVVADCAKLAISCSEKHRVLSERH